MDALLVLGDLFGDAAEEIFRCYGAASLEMLPALAERVPIVAEAGTTVFSFLLPCLDVPNSVGGNGPSTFQGQFLGPKFSRLFTPKKPLPRLIFNRSGGGPPNS